MSIESVDKKIDFEIYREFLVEDERREKQNEVKDHPYIKQYEYYAFKDFNEFLELSVDEAIQSKRLRSSIPDSCEKASDLPWNMLFQVYADYLKGQEISGGTSQNRLIYISKYFKNATFDPSETEKLKEYLQAGKDNLEQREYNREPDYWEEHEVQALFKWEWNPKYELMWRLMYKHARRVGEIQLLKWNNVFIDSEVTLGRENPERPVVVEDGITYPKILKKNKDISYTLPLNDRMKQLIGEMDIGGEYVFQGKGGPITQSTIRDHLQRLTKECPKVQNLKDIPYSSTHRFRHSRGVHMRKEGHESVKAQDLMQHSFSSTTEAFYWSDLTTEESEALYDTIFEELGDYEEANDE